MLCILSMQTNKHLLNLHVTQLSNLFKKKSAVQIASSVSFLTNSVIFGIIHISYLKKCDSIYLVFCDTYLKQRYNQVKQHTIN